MRFPSKETLLECLTARSARGICIRLWMAVLMSAAALIYNVFFISPELAKLPMRVPVLFDIYGEVAEWGHKTELYDYAIYRSIFFVVMCLIGWAVCKAMKNTLHAKRIRLLIIDIANLVVVTVVGITIIYLEIAKGDLSQKLSEHWEYAVMLFWLIILGIEYVTDRKHLKAKSEK